LAVASPNVRRAVAAHVDGTVAVALGTALTTPQGVFITATAHDDLLGYATGKATAHEAALAASAVVFRMDSVVDASIGSGANVEAVNPAAGANLNIVVHAEHQTDILGVAGTFSGAPF